MLNIKLERINLNFIIIIIFYNNNIKLKNKPKEYFK